MERSSARLPDCAGERARCGSPSGSAGTLLRSQGSVRPCPWGFDCGTGSSRRAYAARISSFIFACSWRSRPPLHGQAAPVALPGLAHPLRRQLEHGRESVCMEVTAGWAPANTTAVRHPGKGGVALCHPRQRPEDARAPAPAPTRGTGGRPPAQTGTRQPGAGSSANGYSQITSLGPSQAGVPAVRWVGRPEWARRPRLPSGQGGTDR